MPPTPHSRVRIFGCPVDDLTMESALARVDELVAAGTPARLGAVNAAKLMKMEEDPVLHRAVSGSEVVLADGVGAVFAARLLAGRRVRRVTGIDLMEALVARAAERGWSIYFLGAKAAVLDRAVEVLQARHPSLRVAGRRDGYFTPEEEAGVVADIRAASPDLLFVAMGTPAKEFFIDRHFRATGAAVSMGVGGSFDVVSGHVARAPRWIQRLGLEWFYRFVQEPRRLWHRYFVTSVRFAFRVVGRALRGGERDGVAG